MVIETDVCVFSSVQITLIIMATIPLNNVKLTAIPPLRLKIRKMTGDVSLTQTAPDFLLHYSVMLLQALVSPPETAQTVLSEIITPKSVKQIVSEQQLYFTLIPYQKSALMFVNHATILSIKQQMSEFVT